MRRTTAPPSFHHAEILALYEHDLNIPRKKVEAILALPRETLVADLCLMLQDAVERYEYFGQKNWNENEMEFSLHALWLLADLKEPGTITDVLRFLGQKQEILDFWFVDVLTDDLWEVVFHLGLNSLDELKAFVLNPDFYLYAKAAIGQAVAQIAIHYPDRNEEVVQWYQSVFEHFLSLPDNDAGIDEELISFLVSDTTSFHSRGLLPVIRKLYDQELVYADICGDYADIEQDIRDADPERDRGKVYDNIFERYRYALSSWHYYLEKYDKSYRKAKELEEKTYGIGQPAPFYPPSQKEIAKREGPKVGRNDPCPCGSGKKYKKCCWGK